MATEVISDPYKDLDYDSINAYDIKTDKTIEINVYEAEVEEEEPEHVCVCNCPVYEPYTYIFPRF